MKLLIDNQLPEALAVFLAENAIVTMDEDFQHLAARYGTPPQVVWVRLGNVRKQVLLEAFSATLPDLLAGLASGAPVIEIA